MRRALLVLVLLFATAAGARAQGASTEVVLASGSLVFPGITLNGNDQVLTAVAAPVFDLRYRRPDGFRVTMQASDFVNGAGRTIPASSLRYVASGGTVVVRSGDAGLAETGASGALSQPLTVLVSPLEAKGDYTWQPLPSAFVLVIPADAYAGAYTGVLTLTMTRGL